MVVLHDFELLVYMLSMVKKSITVQRIDLPPPGVAASLTLVG